MAPKSQILEEAGYSYSFDLKIYINRNAKKVFSVEFVQDHSGDELRKRIIQDTEGDEWQLNFNSEPSPGVKRELESILLG